MRRYILLTLVALALLVVPASTAPAVSDEQITVATASIGITRTVTAGMSACVLRLETAQIRWRRAS